MKSLFTDEINEEIFGTIGRGADNSLSIKLSNSNSKIHLELGLEEAIIFQQEVNRYVSEMKEAHRAKLPWWRLGTL